MLGESLNMTVLSCPIFIFSCWGDGKTVPRSTRESEVSSHMSSMLNFQVLQLFLVREISRQVVIGTHSHEDSLPSGPVWLTFPCLLCVFMSLTKVVQISNSLCPCCSDIINRYNTKSLDSTAETNSTSSTRIDLIPGSQLLVCKDWEKARFRRHWEKARPLSSSHVCKKAVLVDGS